MSGFMGLLLAGGTPYVLDKQPASSFDGELAPTDATSGISFAGDGSVSEINGAGFQLVTFGNVANLEVRVTGSGDTPAGSAINTWLAFGSASFTLTQAGFGTKAFTGTYEVRVAATGLSLGGSSFSLDSNVDI